jgi:hypothetical protein
MFGQNRGTAPLINTEIGQYFYFSYSAFAVVNISHIITRLQKS